MRVERSVRPRKRELLPRSHPDRTEDIVTKICYWACCWRTRTLNLNESIQPSLEWEDHVAQPLLIFPELPLSDLCKFPIGADVWGSEVIPVTDIPKVPLDERTSGRCMWKRSSLLLSPAKTYLYSRALHQDQINNIKMHSYYRTRVWLKFI